MKCILWSPTGNTNPKVVFESYDAAAAAAEVMALRCNAKFYVCQLMSYTLPAPKTITQFV